MAFAFPLPCILIPRGCAPFGQHQESRPLARSNTGSPRFTDFTLCMLRVKSDKSDWFWSQSIVFTKPFKTRMSLDSVGLGQRSRFLVLTKKSTASGDENDCRGGLPQVFIKESKSRISPNKKVNDRKMAVHVRFKSL